MPKATPIASRQTENDLIQRIKSLPKYATKAYIDREYRIREAISAYNDPLQDEISSLRIAAGVMDVPYSTLRDRYTGHNTLADNGGHNGLLDEAQEATLINYIDQSIERGLPIRYDMIISAASQILRACGVDKPIGKNWVYRWIKKQQKLDRYHSITTTPLDKQKKREEKEAEKEAIAKRKKVREDKRKEAIAKRKKAREDKRKEADEQRALQPPKRRVRPKKIKSDLQETMPEALMDQSQAIL
ncbi:hypothetical protein GcC1_085030 [Golovinomyces cichoracearum]|uniref:HTH CENPB-type domain-containing protein n=1 Tax=Golovinomyces cichoracearum TaxID=62708 RepID=A0A420IIF7_9PEZI|nr:hypothetical protein GcC1_085030 [Golovinomyces cichoracearum]